MDRTGPSTHGPAEAGHYTKRISAAALTLLLLGPSVSAQRYAIREALARGPQSATSDPAVQRLVDDYIGLYRKETLERWKTLFLPAFTASYTNADGSVTTRNLNEFHDAQRNGFAAGDMSETLHNVRIQRVGRLAHVAADFRFTSRESTRPGQLMLLMIEEKGQFKIAALVFTYHVP
jgi:hypothetical protein